MNYDTERIIRRRRGLIGLDLAELWIYRELFVFLTWRDILLRYKQTALGVLWSVIQPFLTMVVFSVVFGRIAKMPNAGVPYAVLTLSAILPWQFFANSITNSSQSVVGAANMVRKIYFPRLIIPVSSTLSGIVDMLIAVVMLLIVMAYYHVPIRPQMLLMPLFFLLSLVSALSAGFWLSALNVKYRDVKYIVPFIVRMGLYVSPVGFMSSIIPEQYRFWYSLNPMVGVIDGFRWAVLGPRFEPDWTCFLISGTGVLVTFVSGLYYFRNTERTFADVV